jgi:hypothetical protein
VGEKISPDSSSRTKKASADGSDTGSFDHAVTLFCRLLPDHV